MYFGGIIGGIIYNKDIDILECIAILFIWFILVIIFRIIKERSVKAREIIDGKARIIIEHGKVNVENCKNQDFVHMMWHLNFVLIIYIQHIR